MRPLPLVAIAVLTLWFVTPTCGDQGDGSAAIDVPHLLAVLDRGDQVDQVLAAMQLRAAGPGILPRLRSLRARLAAEERQLSMANASAAATTLDAGMRLDGGRLNQIWSALAGLRDLIRDLERVQLDAADAG